MRLYLSIGAALLVCAALVRPVGAEGFTPADTKAAIRLAAEEIGVSYRLLDRIVRCETGETYDPYSVGDRGRSHGAVQLHERGLLPHYKRVSGGASAYNPYASVRYLARVARGDFPGLTLNHWSCY